MSKMLIDEAPVCFSRGLAQKIGLDKAIILQQLHFWIEINKRDGKNYYEDRYWAYSSLEQWIERDFCWWSKRKLITLFGELIELGLLIKKQFKKQTLDCTNYYTINYDNLKKIDLEITAENERKRLKKLEENNDESLSCKNCTIHSAEFATPIVQNLHHGYKDILINKIEKIEESKLNNIHILSSSIDIERLKKIEIKDDDENINTNFPSIFEIKKFVSDLKNNDPIGNYIPAEEYFSKMNALNWTLHGEKIKNWKAYYIRCCDNKQFRVDVENQKIKKGKSYDFTTSGNKAAYEKLLENSI